MTGRPGPPSVPNMRIAVIVATYNRPDALAAVLEGYLAQHDAQFELIVADDGSTEETRRTVEAYRARAAFALSHIWQEDAGFRVAAIRNRALAATGADYVIFSDGDCVPPPHFVAQHRHLAERGWFLAGNRILLCDSFTRRVLQHRLPIHRWGVAQWLATWLRRDINRFLPLLVLPGNRWRKRTPQAWRGVKTCNLSAWRQDLLRVNGFDEAYSSWGLEDSDLVVRLLHSGVRHKSARFATPLFHLWHQENDRSRLAENQQRLDELLQSEHILAARGVNQYF